MRTAVLRASGWPGATKACSAVLRVATTPISARRVPLKVTPMSQLPATRFSMVASVLDTAMS